MIRLEHIALERGGKSLLEDVSLAVPAGTKAILHGPSGCGKSSLLGAIAGVFPLKSGTISVQGMELNEKNVFRIRSMVSFIAQEPVMGAQSVREALFLPFHFAAHAGEMPDEKTVLNLFSELLLPASMLEQDTLTLSGGEKQRLAFVRSLLLKKTVFLADEITSALDNESGEAVRRMLDRPEYTLLAISHDPGFTMAGAVKYRIADRKIIADQGGIV